MPLERLDVLDVADVLVWGTDDAAGAKERDKSPLYEKLRACVKVARSTPATLLAAAIYFTSVLSLPLVVEQFMPTLSHALGG